MIRRLRHMLYLLLACSLSMVPASLVRAAEFDYYVLALSWSPSWCAANDRDGSTQQCRRPHTFVVHGLWPQRHAGWLEDCNSDEPSRVPEQLIRNYFDIVPSAGLAGHEWRKHGTCSGLSQEMYFRTLRRAYAAVSIPPVIFNGAVDRRLGVEQIEALFMRSNPGLAGDAIAVACEGGGLSEIRICMTKSLGFLPCPEVDRRACRQRNISIPALR